MSEVPTPQILSTTGGFRGNVDCSRVLYKYDTPKCLTFSVFKLLGCTQKHTCRGLSFK